MKGHLPKPDYMGPQISFGATAAAGRIETDIFPNIKNQL
jgi:hypothetical protein